MKSALRLTILLSLLLHLLVFTPWFLKDSPLVPKTQPENQTVEFTLQPPVTPPKVQPKPEPQPDIPPPPQHLEDDITQSNTSNGLAQSPSGNPIPPSEGIRDAQDNKQVQEQIAETSPTPTSSPLNPNCPLLSDYLKASWHPDTRPEHLDLGEGTEWKRLEILCASNDAEQGSVHFKAYYQEQKQWYLLEETSKFLFKNGHWFYHSGDYLPQELKPSRNDECPCGSGQKYKKCCL